MKNEFTIRVHELVAKIPKGYVATYGQIALILGNPQAARAVGMAMKSCTEQICWQRVVKSDGSMVFDLQQHLLQQEGIPFMPNGHVNLNKCRWNGEV